MLVCLRVEDGQLPCGTPLSSSIYRPGTHQVLIYGGTLQRQGGTEEHWEASIENWGKGAGGRGPEIKGGMKGTRRKDGRVREPVLEIGREVI